MQKFEIPLYIWLNSMVLVGAAAYVWGKFSGEAAHERETSRPSALGHI